MAQDYKVDIKPQVPAERDAKFLEEHPIEGNIVRLGAGLAGAGDAIGKGVDETKELASKLIEPGDQNPAKMPHPFQALKAGVERITKPGDMKVEHAPHPVDNAIAAAHGQLDNIKNAGVFEGTRIGSAMAVGAIIDGVGPNGRIKAGAKIIEGAGDATKGLNTVNHIKDGLHVTATNAFLHEAAESTRGKLLHAMNEYERTAISAKTYGERFVGDDLHGKALVRFEIAAIRQDALMHGGDASINNPVIADLTKNGTASHHFYPNNVMQELKKYNPNQAVNHEEAAANLALQATKQSNIERLKFLQDLEKQGAAISPQQMVELSVGKQYGPDAAAHARELASNRNLDKVNEIYPHRSNLDTDINGQPHVVSTSGKSGTDRYGNLMSQNLGDYLKVREPLLDKMSVDNMRELARIETENMEKLVKVKEADLAGSIPNGVDRRASQSPIAGVSHIDEDEYKLIQSAHGLRAGDESIRKFSESNTFNGFQAREAIRNKLIAETNARAGHYPKLELIQYQDALEYMRLRQIVFESPEYDSAPDRMRDIFRKENQAVNQVSQPISQMEKLESGKDQLSFKDAINYLENSEAKAIVLARFQEQREALNQRQSGVELG